METEPIPGLLEPRPPGAWETRARGIVARLREAGYLTDITAGYGDSLEQAGADRDSAELRGSMGDRFRAANGWDRALSRIVPPPAEGTIGDGTTNDPWEKLSETLRSAATMGDAPNG